MIYGHSIKSQCCPGEYSTENNNMIHTTLGIKYTTILLEQNNFFKFRSMRKGFSTSAHTTTKNTTHSSATVVPVEFIFLKITANITF